MWRQSSEVVVPNQSLGMMPSSIFIFGVYISFLFACVFWLKFIELRFCHTYPKPWHMYLGHRPMWERLKQNWTPTLFLTYSLKSTRSREEHRDAYVGETQVTFPFCLIQERLQEKNHPVQKIMKISYGTRLWHNGNIKLGLSYSVVTSRVSWPLT